jgi:hypothetical protein
VGVVSRESINKLYSKESLMLAEKDD